MNRFWLFIVLLILQCASGTLLPGHYGGTHFQVGRQAFRIESVEFDVTQRYDVIFEKEFKEKPVVAASIEGFDMGADVPNMDIKVLVDPETITNKGFQIQVRLVSPNATDIRKCFVSWIAFQGGLSQFGPIIDSYSLYGSKLNPEWKLYSGESRQFFAPYDFNYRFSKVPNVVYAITGLGTEGAPAFTITSGNLTKEHFYEAITSYGNTKISYLNSYWLAVQSGYHGNILNGFTQIEADSLNLGESQWGSGTFHFGKTPNAFIRVNFRRKFSDFWAYTSRKPRIFLGINALNMTDSARSSLRLEITEVEKDGFDLNVMSSSLTNINGIGISYVAVMEIDPVIRAYDWIFILLLVVFMIVCLGRAMYIYCSKTRDLVDIDDVEIDIEEPYTIRDEQIDPLGSALNPKILPDPVPSEEDLKVFKGHWNKEIKRYQRAKQKSAEKLRTALITRVAVFWSIGILFTLGSAAGFYYAYTQAWLEGIRTEIAWIILIAMMGFDYVMFICSFAVPYPLPTSGSRVNNVACIIPCHRSAKKAGHFFELVLRLARLKFGADAVFICDNANSLSPPDDDYDLMSEKIRKEKISTKNLCDKLGLNYVYVPEGNKTLAMYWVCKNWLPHVDRTNRFKYDDDVLIPPNLRIPDFLNEPQDPKYPIVGYAFVIQATNAKIERKLMEELRSSGDLEEFICSPNDKGPFAPTKQKDPGFFEQWLVGSQDLEYKLAGALKYFQAKMGSTVTPHGALSLWDREKLVDAIFPCHNTVFNGDDLQMGLICRKINPNWRIKVEASVSVPTNVPIELFYRSPTSRSREKTLFFQRVYSWDVTAHRYTHKFIEHILFYWSVKTMIVKIAYIQELLVLIQDWLRLFLLVYAILSYQWLVVTSFMVRILLLQYTLYLIFNYLKLAQRRSLAVNFSTVLMFPMYRLLGLFFRYCALYQNLFVWAAQHRNFFTIKQRETGQNDLPPPKTWELNIIPYAKDWKTFWKIDESIPIPAEPSKAYFGRLIARERQRRLQEGVLRDTKDRDLRVMEGILRLMEQISTFVKDYRGGPIQTETRIRRKYSSDSESSEVVDEGEQMMKQLQQLSDVILNPNTSEQERNKANYEYDQLCKDFEHTKLFKQLMKDKQEQEKAILEQERPLDQEALQQLQELQKQNDPNLMDRLRKLKPLELIFMPQTAITRKHQKDFNQYMDLSSLTLQELRAIRANMPEKVKDEKQKEFLESLNIRVKEMIDGKPKLEKVVLTKDAKVPEKIDIGTKVQLSEAKEKLQEFFATREGMA